ncbi:hypothetical protein A0128_19795 [Leptospira tipperaryensis]|uniref:Methyl-accepting transducer domain-containing protein n=1 Tax=Leptospira tipperaryensis TaxID=2564040 RepID=A0A1D7V359_9LEPT|nr:hypothetical protein [Leptospira tipperaryensis]AOP36272.1 hypothetical protein A0128_19795 [Leptospira tipperaryensis]
MEKKLLRKTAFINEDVKAISSLAFGIRVKALNSIILSSRAGSAAKGFGVVAQEIIVFSKTTTTITEELTKVMYSLSREASHQVKNRIAFEKAKKIENYGNKSGALARMILSFETKESGFQKATFSIQNTMLNRSKNLIRQCLDGKVISLQAKIESEYIGVDKAKAGDVAEKFSAAIDSIENLAKKILDGWKYEKNGNDLFQSRL